MHDHRSTTWLTIVMALLALAATLLLVLSNHVSKQINLQSKPAKVPIVVVAGDIACPPGAAKTTYTCRDADTAKLVTSLKPQAVLTVGDNQYPAGALEAFQSGYDRSWGAFKDITYPTPGNHDYNTADAGGYYEYFGSRAGEKGKGYYSFKIGSWRLFALSSEIDVSESSPQLAWLKQEITDNPSTCTLAYWHKPRFSSGGHHGNPTFDALWRLLHDNRVDIVVNGHSHSYERYVPQNPGGQHDPQNGITEFVSGLGGYGPQALNQAPDTLVARQNHAFGVLKLALYAKTAHYEFVPIAASQDFSDKGVIDCH